jgi:transcriptional antiterminator RfaH
MPDLAVPRRNALASRRPLRSVRAEIAAIVMASHETDSRVNWFCLRAQPRREHIAALNLRRRVGVDVFAPRIRIHRAARSGASALIAEPLFPGYVFARFDFAGQFRHVISTSGITGVVRFGTQPPAIANGVIDFLRAQMAAADRPAAAPFFAEGMWVRIVAGYFRQVEGRVVSFDSKTERVRLLLNLLGQDVQVSVPARQLVSLDGQAAALPRGLLVSQLPVAPVAG